MILTPLALRLDPTRPFREELRGAAKLGARGVVIDAAGDLGPDRLSETGRREVRHLLRTAEVELVALSLPTRRPFDTVDQLDDRLRRAERAFALAFDLGTRLVLARVGALPPELESSRREIFAHAVNELGRRADHRGVRLAIETGTEPGEVLRSFLDEWKNPGLAASIDPNMLMVHGHEPSSTVRALGPWVAHAYMSTPASLGPRPRSVTSAGATASAGLLDWEEYLGALEEVNYRGFLTVWPDPALDLASQFSAIAERLSHF